jgi:hypothetical protein
VAWDERVYGTLRYAFYLGYRYAFSIVGSQGKNDVAYLADRLERLPPEQFAAVETFLNQVFEMFTHFDG